MKVWYFIGRVVDLSRRGEYALILSGVRSKTVLFCRKIGLLFMKPKSFSEVFKASGMPVEDLAKSSSGFWMPEPVVREEYKDFSETVLEGARLLHSGKISFLGEEFQYCRKGVFNWFYDPVSDFSFDSEIHFSKWEYESMKQKGSDIKYPWELSRCQHWFTFYQAWVLSGKVEMHRERVREEMLSFCTANPVEWGINWTCTMDVGLRAVSWCILFPWVNCILMEEERWRLIEYLYDHGNFIRANLENTSGVTSNHYLSNVVGLYFLGCFFDGLNPGRQWKVFSKKEIESEIEKQVLEDGMNFESSVPYHRLVLELFLISGILGERVGDKFSIRFYSRLKEMVTFLWFILTPDGRIPQIGDSDDGRVLITEGYGVWKPEEGTHLFGVASKFLGKRWNWPGNRIRDSWQKAWWGFDSATQFYDQDIIRREVETKVFPAGGLAVIRFGREARLNGSYLTVCNSKVGTNGVGNHKHNDLLGFEWHAEGIPIFIDAGVGLYTSNPEVRNEFRSVKFHNTFSINGMEPNRMVDGVLFHMFENAYPWLESDWKETDSFYEISCGHSGYQSCGVSNVARTFRISKSNGDLAIQDSLELEKDSEPQSFRWHFHGGGDVKFKKIEERKIAIVNPNKEIEMNFNFSGEISIFETQYSPSYGKFMKCQAIEIDFSANSTNESFEFSFCGK